MATEAFSGRVPSGNDPLVKVTVPEGVPVPGGLMGAMVAVRLSGERYVEPLGVAVRVDVEGRPRTLTVQEAVLPLRVEVGAKVTVRMCEPALRPV